MKTSPQVKTLAEQIRWQLMWLGSGLFISCLLLVFLFALRASELTTESLMMLEAETLLRQTADFPDLPLPRDKTLSAYRQWADLPEPLRQHFDDAPIPGGKVIEIPIADSDGNVEFYYLLHHSDVDYGEIYTLSHHDSAEIEAIFIRFFKSAFSQALWLSAIIFIILFLLIRWLIRRTTEPLAMLSRWATMLIKDPQQSIKIDFPIEELNQLATQLREGVDKLQAYNEREQQFLKHASHELRTPLAIIQASLDTLHLQSNESSQPAVQRALKASANMRQLSTALLWLARESGNPVKRSKVAVRELCQQIIKDHNPLLRHRGMEIRTRITVETLHIESELLAIVISNLIRNAFQYSTVGEIILNLTADGLKVTNAINNETETNEKNSESGFGLGLQLVKRICQKLNWRFSFTMEKLEVSVSVLWTPQNNSIN